MNESKEKFSIDNDKEGLTFDDLNCYDGNLEIDKKQFKPLSFFIDLIDKARNLVLEKSKTANNKDRNMQAIAELDRILISNAESSTNIDDIDAAIVEGVIEETNGSYGELENPIITIENDGYDQLLTGGIVDLYENELELDSGENIAFKAAKILEKAEAEKIMLKNIENFDINHYCCETTRFIDQSNEADRDSLVTYIANQEGLYTRTSESKHIDSRKSATEQECLIELQNFLSKAVDSDFTLEHQKSTAKNILENLTWIGEKEYKEATKLIAEYWKFELRDNPNLRIFPIAGNIAKELTYCDEKDPSKKQIKSDEWCLDNILSNFTDDEMSEFSDRLLMLEHHIPENMDPKDLKLILLDDWTISGTQLSKVHKSLSNRLPQYKECFEVQLIASNENRIKNNMKCFDDNGGYVEIPLRAYYKAHSKENLKPLITGYHSSVDFDFEIDISNILTSLVESGDQNLRQLKMPAGTNIVRPYRQKKSLNNRDRMIEAHMSKLYAYLKN